MLRKPISLLQQQKRKIPSLIAMLSSKASSLNRENSKDENFLHQDVHDERFASSSSLQPSAIAVLTQNQPKLTKINKENEQQQQQQQNKQRKNPSLVFADLSRLKSRYSQSEIERRQTLTKMKQALANVEVQFAELDHQISAGSIVTDDNDGSGVNNNSSQLRMLSHARYNLARKLRREEIASSEQRKILLKVFRYLKSSLLKESIKEISSVFENQQQQQNENNDNNHDGEISTNQRKLFTGNTVNALNEFVSNVGFFSGALRRVQRNMIARELSDFEQSNNNKSKNKGMKFGEEDKKPLAKILEKQFSGKLLPNSLKNQIRETITIAVTSSTISPNNSNSNTTFMTMTPKQAISLLFNSAKSGLLFTTNNSSSSSSTSSEEALLKSLATSFHPALFSAWDTLQLTVWMTATMLRIRQQQQQNNNVNNHDNNNILPLLFSIYKDLLLRHLWIQNAAQLNGFSTWFILSCIPQLDECFREAILLKAINNNNDNKNKVEKVFQSIDAMKDNVVAVLVPHCTRMLNSPVAASTFAEPWNSKNNSDKQDKNDRTKKDFFHDKNARASFNPHDRAMNLLNSLDDDTFFGIKPARIDSIENELSIKFSDPKKLISILTLINSESMRKISSAYARAERLSLQAMARRKQARTGERRLGDVSSDSAAQVVSNKMMLHSHLSLARSVVYGSLARTLHHAPNIGAILKNLPDISLLLLVACGPGIDSNHLDSRVEAASVSNLIDSIYVQLFYVCENLVRNSQVGEKMMTTTSTTSNEGKNKDNDDNNNDNIDKLYLQSRRNLAVAIVRAISCLSHLSGKGFLLGKRKHEDNNNNHGEKNQSSNNSDMPTPKSRIMSQVPGIYGGSGTSSIFSSTTNGQHKDRVELQIKFSKDQLVGLFFKALFAVPNKTTNDKQNTAGRSSSLSLPLIETFDTNSVATRQTLDVLEHSLHATGNLTQFRAKEMQRVRGLLLFSSPSSPISTEATAEDQGSSSSPSKSKSAQDAILALRARQLFLRKEMK